MAVLIPVRTIRAIIIQFIQIKSPPAHLMIRGLTTKSSKNMIPRTIPRKNLMTTMKTLEMFFSEFIIAYMKQLIT
jgi:hypothetical protein